MSKSRLDVILVQRGLAESREKAARMIGAGAVRVNGHPVTKAGQQFPDDCVVDVESPPRFVSRGGEKLEHALRHFGLSVSGCICADVGASTGGFTDCLLQNGASRVYAVDVGRGQLHWRLRNDSRVICVEETNARHLTSSHVPEKADVITVDVSFISLTKVLPAVIQVARGGAAVVTLIKPQFEAGRERVCRGGVVRDPAVRAEVVESIRRFGERVLKLTWDGVCESPLLGPAGNVEFLALWRVPREAG
jgi:23S rRNA (cytidine1920-2'-O)/16S rRNA (cytidine1409-2'-O)-methyltransferase